MTNYNVFSNQRDPLIIQDTSAASTRLGLNYRATTGVVAVPAGNFLALQLNNPTSSRYSARIGRIFGGALSTTALFLLRNATVAGGTTLQPVNTNFGFTSTSQLIPTFSVSSVNPAVGGGTFSTILETAGAIFQ